MDKDYFKNYLDEIKSKYDIEKKGKNSIYLLNPTRAKLRKLCIEKFKDESNNNDLKTFNFFMGFQFNINNLKKIKDNTDKFRPIETFFKGETILSDDEGADMAAILINFDKRPFSRYRDLPKNNILDNTIAPTNDKKPDEGDNGKPIKLQPVIHKNSNWTKKDLIYIAIGITLFIGIFLGINNFMNSKKSIEWVNDHYEEIESNNEQGNSSQFLINEKLLNTFKKITPCDTTTYRKNGRACLWYGKSSKGEIEFFTALDVHPETGKTLKEVTDYIMNKYGKGPCK